MSNYVVLTDGSRCEIEPANGVNFQLHEIYQILGVTIIEAHRLKDGSWMVIDEEGKLNGSEYNKEATRLFHESYGGYDWIVGDALICEKDALK